MHGRRIPILFAAAAIFCGGCSDNAFIGSTGTNAPPTIKLVNGPVEQDVVGYKVELSWLGEDRDGKVERYEFVICNGAPLGFNRQDTTGLDKWTKTARTDSIFKLAADQYDTTLTIGGNQFSRFKKTHTFFVRAVDDRGSRSEPAYRSFTTWTLAPGVNIDFPPNAFPGHAQTLPPIVRFHWEGIDPRDDPWHVAKVDSIRYLLTVFTDSTVQELNEHLGSFESRWSPWIATDAPGDSGVSTIIGDDEMLDMQKRYVFAVQAQDDAGAVTSIFDMRSNVRVFALLKVVGPELAVKETFLGLHKFLGTKGRPQTFSLPANFVFSFTWKADASEYGGIISGYRYGWDVADLSNPNEWEVPLSPYTTWAPPRSFSSGVHTLFVEAVDNNGYSTLAQIEISIFPIDMSRNLLWVDDFYSTDFVQIDYSFPTEKEHDQFWLRICARARDFKPDRDVFDTKDLSFIPPRPELLWKYRNIIWTYSSDSRFGTWDNMVRFTPESHISTLGHSTFNLLAYYMASGGHLWTCGRSDRQGGLAAVLSENAQRFPLYLRCEIDGPQWDCADDTSGVESMAYRDYCVSVLDKVLAMPRNTFWWFVPERRIEWDAMSYGYLDPLDEVTGARPGMPGKLQLWSTVTKPGNFFDPQVRGFTFVEVYDVQFWMDFVGESSQSCFHPLYRMRARNSVSAINGAVIAFWTTKYADVAAPVPGAIAAPSVHFGLPLWYFNRAQVDSIADAIFDEWEIGEY
ncbi:MAG: hypothetical protein NTW97_05850 [Candidatus Krumholzibacteria bacterium]|nr:hypothetical protein [Candidatus Krumholzibacteria bacterium]